MTASRTLFCLSLFVLPLAACGAGSGECPVGSQGCACTSGKACNAGLGCTAEGFCAGAGVVQDFAGVDHAGNPNPGGVKRVFVTSTPYNGAFGSVQKGDALCVATAKAAGVGGTWVAWLSDQTKEAVDHVSDVSP